MLIELLTMDSDYKVNLDIYKGPLDLLLHLIHEEEVDIYDIPIARITDSYLQHLKTIKEMDLDNVGDFIVMAARLIDIKARMLLPVNEEEEEVEDPREELITKLLEYKKFRTLSSRLEEIHENQCLCFPRAVFSAQEQSDDSSFSFPTLEKIALSFSHLAKDTLMTLESRLRSSVTPLNRYKEKIFSLFKSTCNKITLHMLKDKTVPPEEKVGYFLAALDMASKKTVRLYQIIPFGKIFVSLKNKT